MNNIQPITNYFAYFLSSSDDLNEVLSAGPYLTEVMNLADSLDKVEGLLEVARYEVAYTDDCRTVLRGRPWSDQPWRYVVIEEAGQYA